MTSPLTKLKAATTRKEVAVLLGIAPKTLAYLLYIRPEAVRYTTFEIAKKNGSKRQINAPAKDLKDLQRSLATFLQKCIDEIDATEGYVNTTSHGFTPGKDIVSNAFPHRSRRYVFNLDLTDFFGTITFRRLRGYFIKDHNFALHEDVATVVAQIACHQSKLPQGSPCSPIMSNLIGRILDFHLLKLARDNGCTYTRYADDLTFSTNKKQFPKSIACIKPGEIHAWKVGRQLAGLIKKCDFEINPAKTRMQYKDSRQEVTGLVTNRKINVRSEYRHEVRAMVHRLFTTGSFQISTFSIDANGNSAMQEVDGLLDQLHGRLGFIHAIDEGNRKLVTEHPYNYTAWPKKSKPTGNESIYLRFLLYKLFFANPKPMIICEGKTDNIYLANAIHSLHTTFPQLIKLDAQGKRVLDVQIFKYADTSTGKILGNESGGAPGLSKLIQRYVAESRFFTAPLGKHPAIVLIDNDTGATGSGNVYATLTNLKLPKPTGTEPYIHVAKNLYVVATPLNGAPSSCIEDFFTPADKAVVIDGKIFDPTDKLDKSTHYGKAVFAHKVIAADPGKIDFSLFPSLIKRLVDVIDHYHASHP